MFRHCNNVKVIATNGGVFISYAPDTEPLAEQLTQDLEEQGIESWVDFKNLQPGQHADWFLLLVGSKSRTTPQLEAEWSAALACTWENPKKRFLPVVFGNGQPPPFLRNWVVLRVNLETEVSTWTRRVLDTLRNVRSAEVQSDSPKTGKEFQKRLAELGDAVEALWEYRPDAHSAEHPPLK